MDQSVRPVVTHVAAQNCDTQCDDTVWRHNEMTQNGDTQRNHTTGRLSSYAARLVVWSHRSRATVSAVMVVTTVAVARRAIRAARRRSRRWAARRAWRTGRRSWRSRWRTREASATATTVRSRTREATLWRWAPVVAGREREKEAISLDGQMKVDRI